MLFTFEQIANIISEHLNKSEFASDIGGDFSYEICWALKDRASAGILIKNIELKINLNFFYDDFFDENGNKLDKCNLYISINCLIDENGNKLLLHKAKDYKAKDYLDYFQLCAKIAQLGIGIEELFPKDFSVILLTEKQLKQTKQEEIIKGILKDKTKNMRVTKWLQEKRLTSKDVFELEEKKYKRKYFDKEFVIEVF